MYMKPFVYYIKYIAIVSSLTNHGLVRGHDLLSGMLSNFKCFCSYCTGSQPP